MPLPQSNSGEWPPPSQARRLPHMQECDAWYSGSAARLAAVYGGGSTPAANVRTTINPNGRGTAQRSLTGQSGRLWAKSPADGEADTKRHLPIAQDIATGSAELLYSQPPRFIVDGPVWDADAEEGVDPATGEPITAHRKGEPMPETVVAQERLDLLLDANNIEALLLATGEVAAALGNAGLRIAFDRASMRYPRLTRADADSIVPHYVWGELVGVTFWRVVQVPRQKDKVVYRHLELHEGGRIFHGLYEGDAELLGVSIPMGEGDATCQTIAAALDEDSAVRNFRVVLDGMPVRTATSIPNMLPDPLDRANEAGRSDYTPAVIDLMDAADALYTQFMENVDDAKGRILLGRNMLESAGIGKGLTFNVGQRLFQKLNVSAGEREDGKLPIEKVQFELRSEEYLASIEAMTIRALEAAGYTARSENNADGRDRTATEVLSDDSRSHLTRQKKINYQRNELEEMATALLVVDAAYNESGVTPFRVRVEFPPATIESLASRSATAKTLRDARLASDEVLVQYLHPEWDAGEVANELARLTAVSQARQLIDPAVIGLSPGRPLPGDAQPPAEPSAAPTPTPSPA